VQVRLLAHTPQQPAAAHTHILGDAAHDNLLPVGALPLAHYKRLAATILVHLLYVPILTPWRQLALLSHAATANDGVFQRSAQVAVRFLAHAVALPLPVLLYLLCHITAAKLTTLTTQR
jgi:hypothetical protein